MTIAKKQFDAVATMREIRDRISGQVEGMSFEEEKRFIRKRVPQPKPRPSKEPPNTTLQPTSRAWSLLRFRFTPGAARG
jgi:hypothetical protein